MSDKTIKQGKVEKLAGSSRPDSYNTQPTWHTYHFKLVPGALYYFKSDEKKKARGLVELLEAKLEETKVDKKRSITIYVAEIKFTIAPPKDEFDDWFAKLKENIGVATNNPFKVEGRDEISGSGQKGVIFRAKKTMAGSAAASGLGKAVLKKVIDEDNRRLIDAIKKMVTEFHGKEKAEFVEKSIIKLTVKTFLLVQNGNLQVGDLLKIEESLQKALKLLIKCFYSLDKVEDSVLLEKFYIIGALASNVEEILVELLKPHLKEKSIKRVSATFSLLLDSQFLIATCNNKKLREDLTIVIKEAEWYVNVYDQASF